MKKKIWIGMSVLMVLFIATFAQAGLLDVLGNIFNPVKKEAVTVTVDTELKKTAETATGTTIDDAAILEEIYLVKIELTVSNQFNKVIRDLCFEKQTETVNNMTITRNVPIDKKACIEKKKKVIDFVKELNLETI
jgi:hypothetical protein